METPFLYCMPEWFEELAQTYRSNPENEEQLKKLTSKMVYRVSADSAFGIEKDILFCAYFTAGRLDRVELISEQDAMAEADFVMAATCQTWKAILRREEKFVGEFMGGRIKLDKGNAIGAMRIAPYADKIVNSLASVEFLFGDELTEEDRQKYKENLERLRTELAV